MATKKPRTSKEDDRKARARYIDQPGQWVDVTPPDVKERQRRDWEKLHKMIAAEKKQAAAKAAKKKK